LIVTPVAAALFLLAAAASPSSASEALPRVVLTGPDVGVMFRGDFGPPFWSPSPAEIAEAEGKLSTYLTTAPNPDANDIPPRLDGYGRQYFGITAKGRRILVINAFCRAGERDFSRRLVIVADGGDCYFQAFYDMIGHRFAGIAVNGYA
jgi:hypothetical protein